jgi:hypothetical protein
MFGGARTTGSGVVFEAVLAFPETVGRLLDGLEPNQPFSIRRVDLTRDFGIRRILGPEEMNDGADFMQHERC